MARLLVKLHGESVSRLTLEDGVEYIAGRANDANIQLGHERGISRHHLKFCQRNGVWVCESLSKFVLIQKAGASVEVVELTEACVFSVPPYEFSFEPSVRVESQRPQEPVPSENNLPVTYQAEANHNTADETSPGVASTRPNNEATMAGVASSLVPYLRLSFPNTADDEVLKLEGHLWVAGRDQKCEIAIDSAHVSRKHFELARTNDGFYVTDLGSRNGTVINGQQIPPHEPKKIESGDEIQIKNIYMTFEIRDAGFSHRVDHLPVPAFETIQAPLPLLYQPPAMYDHHPQMHEYDNAPVPWKQIRPHHLKDPVVRTRVIRAALFVMIPLLFVVLMLPTSKPPEAERTPATSANANTSVSFEKLTNEQRSVVRDSFTLARNLYLQGKYELCLAELAKVHDIIPIYENSKELQSVCQQGKVLVEVQRDTERKERERQNIESQISGYVEACVAKLKDAGSVDETRLCLAPAMELDPEHHLIVEMIHSAQVHESDRKALAEQRANTSRKAAQGVAHYNKAKTLYKEGNLFKAVGAYENFLHSSYPHAETLKNTAQREVASIKQELKSKVETLLSQCKSLGGKNKYKEAYIACDQAMLEDPENKTAKEERGHMASELKRELKAVYEDSVLEESLGNVDSAKEKWKRIVKDDLQNGEYWNKARSKLQKYGIEN